MKICTGCNEELNELSFDLIGNGKPHRRNQCRACRAQYLSQRKHIGQYNMKKKIIAREFVFEYLKSKSCVDCGISDPRVLEFDHVRGEKTTNVSAMVGSGYSIKVIAAEIEKCEVRCANCHRIATADRGGFWRSRMAVTA